MEKKRGQRELEWIGSHPEEVEKHAGEWIAIVENKIVAHGESLHEVRKKAKELTGKEPLVFKVPRPDEELYILWS